MMLLRLRTGLTTSGMLLLALLPLLLGVFATAFVFGGAARVGALAGVTALLLVVGTGLLGVVFLAHAHLVFELVGGGCLYNEISRCGT